MWTSDAPDSAFVGFFVTPQTGLVFEWRVAPGAATQQQVVPALAAPITLRLTRTGNNFAAFYSTNGINYTVFGPTQTVTMPQTILAGVAVSSNNESELAKALFTGVAAGKTLAPGAVSREMKNSGSCGLKQAR